MDFVEAASNTWAPFTLPYPTPKDHMDKITEHYNEAQPSAIQVLDIFGEVFGRPEKKPKLNLKLKESQRSYNIPSGDSFDFKVNGSQTINVGDPVYLNDLDYSSVSPQASYYGNDITDIGRITFQNKPKITLKLK